MSVVQFSVCTKLTKKKRKRKRNVWKSNVKKDGNNRGGLEL